MAPRFWIGTSGWHYKHWRGDFYPRELPTSAWLEFYARRFPTVEINNSFYAQPRESTWDRWREGSPAGFRFAVKASRYLTHIKRLADPEASLERVFAGARRLEPKLGPVLYQLPPGFPRSQENVGRLDHFLALLPPDADHVFEFRNPEWLVPATLEQLGRAGAAFCAYDMPGVECPLAVTGRIAYVRFHGSGARYGGNYDDASLERWAARLMSVAGAVDEAYVYFNNDIGGHAPRNAARLQDLLAAA